MPVLEIGVVSGILLDGANADIGLPEMVEVFTVSAPVTVPVAVFVPLFSGVSWLKAHPLFSYRQKPYIVMFLQGTLLAQSISVALSFMILVSLL